MTSFDVTFLDYTTQEGWQLARALEVLEVTTESFNYERNPHADGYSYLRVLSIRPSPALWTVPVIAAHELAHIVLEHTKYVAIVEDLGLDTSEIPFGQFELEAHMVAKAVCIGLGLGPEEFNRELMQCYIDSARAQADPLSDSDAIRLARATLQILEAGLVPAEVMV